MTANEVMAAAAQAWALLVAYPLQWAAVVAAFLLVVESLTFIPRVGFVVKLAVAGLIVPQFIKLFAAAAQGQAPSVGVLLWGWWAWPPATMVALVAASWLPFAVGIGLLWMQGGQPATAFFFGNVFKTAPPSPAQFARFKLVMQAAAWPFTLLPGAVALKGLVGLAALTAALSAAMANLLPMVLLAALALAFEWACLRLPTRLPKWLGVSLGLLLLMAYLVWSLAFTYVISQHILV